MSLYANMSVALPTIYTLKIYTNAKYIQELIEILGDSL